MDCPCSNEIGAWSRMLVDDVSRKKTRRKALPEGCHSTREISGRQRLPAKACAHGAFRSSADFGGFGSPRRFSHQIIDHCSHALKNLDSQGLARFPSDEPIFLSIIASREHRCAPHFNSPRGTHPFPDEPDTGSPLNVQLTDDFENVLFTNAAVWSHDGPSGSIYDVAPSDPSGVGV